MKVVSKFHSPFLPTGICTGLVVLNACIAQALTFTVINTSDSGTGSLRQAILNANANSGADTIAFNIPGSGVHTIAPSSALPTIISPVTIDGYTQPGASINTLANGDNVSLQIELNGSGAGATTTGLTIKAGNSTVQGLVINRFKANGILLYGAGNNHVNGNFIGTDAGGTVDQGNVMVGVKITGGAGNQIGGAAPTERNLISGNNSNGVELANSGTTSNQVLGNYIGTDKDGTVDLGNSQYGVSLSKGASGNTIGGTTTGALNLISGNDMSGIRLLDSNTTGNQIQGNFIGLRVGGFLALGNGADGILVSNAPGNVIGGTVVGARNAISLNKGNGVQIVGDSAVNNLVQGNFIGSNKEASGTGTFGNEGNGVFINGAPNNIIGGAVSAARNVILQNRGSGVQIAGSGATGNQVLGNFIGTEATGAATPSLNQPQGVFINGAPNNIVGGAASGARNLISGNLDGVLIQSSSATGNQVLGNYIGLDDTGTVNLHNLSNGIRLDNAPNNTIGGIVSGARNVIAGGGIRITGGSSTHNQVLGNYIGTNAAGNAGLGINGSGVLLSGVANNTVGGTAAGAGNLISGGSDGVKITGGAATGNRVLGNYIGLNAAGTGRIANANGVTIDGAANNTIGGTPTAARNVISGNGQGGVQLINAATGNQVLGNTIGLNAAGTAKLGNNGLGISIEQSDGNTVGGATAGARNVISGNAGRGIAITRNSGIGNVVLGNYIGTGPDGTTNRSNTKDGVLLSSASNNRIGGTNAGEGNVIAFNGGDGVFMTPISGLAPGTGNRIVGNSIFSNTGLGIDLAPDGATANDAGDADTGVNNLQNFPVLSSAAVTSSTTNIDGSLNSTAGQTFAIDFYASPSADPSGFGEGKTYVGRTVVTTDGSGDVTFTFDAPGDLSGQVITATATRNDTNDTSEFSHAVAVTP